MATMSTDELLDVFKNMTVLELNDFLKKFEEEFDVVVSLDSTTRRTLQYTFTIVRGATLIGHGRMTSVCVRKQGDGSMHAVSAPPDIVERLTRAAGVDASHRGRP